MVKLVLLRGAFDRFELNETVYKKYKIYEDCYINKRNPFIEIRNHISLIMQFEVHFLDH